MLIDFPCLSCFKLLMSLMFHLKKKIVKLPNSQSCCHVSSPFPPVPFALQRLEPENSWEAMGTPLILIKSHEVMENHTNFQDIMGIWPWKLGFYQLTYPPNQLDAIVKHQMAWGFSLSLRTRLGPAFPREVSSLSRNPIDFDPQNSTSDTSIS